MLRPSCLIALGFMIPASVAVISCTGSPGDAFDTAQWSDEAQVEAGVRRGMADGLVADEVLIGRTRAEVVAMLGEPPPTEYFRNWDLVYWLGPERGFISIDSEWLVVRLSPESSGRAGSDRHRLILASPADRLRSAVPPAANSGTHRANARVLTSISDSPSPEAAEPVLSENSNGRKSRDLRRLLISGTNARLDPSSTPPRHLLRVGHPQPGPGHRLPRRGETACSRSNSAGAACD